MPGHLAGRAAGILIFAAFATALTSCASQTSQPENAAATPAAGAMNVANQPNAVPPAHTTIPAQDAKIQRWYLDNDKVKIAFDNALFQAEQGIANQSAKQCKPLAQAAHTIGASLPRLRNLPSPAGAKIADAIAPVMTTMEQIGNACASGDFATAQKLLPTGVQQQADAQENIDAILDGDK